ncbi:MAG: hypothetical protein BIFFINMI_01589 [Phycisphaerae bacterium]|nr:hypothetical protein [Phycisphaerae bacterium]
MKSLSVKVPDAIKKALPASMWGRILSATPVVMAVVATMLAGLSSSEMTRAQYDRSLAAQHQSKAGDQWAFFQAKRLRGASQRNTVDVLTSLAHPRAADRAMIEEAAASLAALADQTKAKPVHDGLLALIDPTGGAPFLAALEKAEVPQVPAAGPPPAEVKAALEAMDSSKPEADVDRAIAAVTEEAYQQALTAAEDRVAAMDDATESTTRAMDRFQKLMDQRAELLRDAGIPANPAVDSGVAVARLRYTAARYDAEARLNQAVASLLELEVRRNNISSQRHHRRSQSFFYGMLAAQLGVIIATFAVAARRRNLLWSLAAVAGLIAVSFGLYVYLWA